MKSLCNNVQMSNEQVEFYDREGYVIVDDVMSYDNCNYLQSIADKLADEQFSVVLNIHRKVSEFTEVAKDVITVNLVKSVQRSAVVALNSQYLFKKCNTPYGRQSWTPHQDNSYPKAKNGTYIIVHLSLEDSDKENGGLIFWPKSHVEDILPYKNNKSWKEDFDKDKISRPGQTIEIPSQYISMDMSLKKGSLCLMHGNLIHGSHPNLSYTRSRPQYSIAYLNKGEDFNPGKTSVKEVMEVE